MQRTRRHQYNPNATREWRQTTKHNPKRHCYASTNKHEIEDDNQQTKRSARTITSSAWNQPQSQNNLDSQNWKMLTCTEPTFSDEVTNRNQNRTNDQQFAYKLTPTTNSMNLPSPKYRTTSKIKQMKPVQHTMRYWKRMTAKQNQRTLVNLNIEITI